jgi:hypothetical protein
VNRCPVCGTSMASDDCERDDCGWCLSDDPAEVARKGIRHARALLDNDKGDTMTNALTEIPFKDRTTLQQLGIVQTATVDAVNDLENIDLWLEAEQEISRLDVMVRQSRRAAETPAR